MRTVEQAKQWLAVRRDSHEDADWFPTPGSDLSFCTPSLAVMALVLFFGGKYWSKNGVWGWVAPPDADGVSFFCSITSPKKPQSLGVEWVIKPGGSTPRHQRNWARNTTQANLAALGVKQIVPYGWRPPAPPASVEADAATQTSLLGLLRGIDGRVSEYDHT